MVLVLRLSTIGSQVPGQKQVEVSDFEEVEELEEAA